MQKSKYKVKSEKPGYFLLSLLTFDFIDHHINDNYIANLPIAPFDLPRPLNAFPVHRTAATSMPVIPRHSANPVIGADSMIVHAKSRQSATMAPLLLHMSDIYCPNPEVAVSAIVSRPMITRATAKTIEAMLPNATFSKTLRRAAFSIRAIMRKSNPSGTTCR